MDIDAILKHFNVPDEWGESLYHVLSHPERLAEIDPVIFGMINMKKKNRIILEYDPDFPYCVVQVRELADLSPP